MNFNEWLNTLDLANLNDLPPNDGMEMGWFACKEEILKILDKSNCPDLPKEIIKEIENL